MYTNGDAKIANGDMSESDVQLTIDANDVQTTEAIGK